MIRDYLAFTLREMEPNINRIQPLETEIKQIRDSKEKKDKEKEIEHQFQSLYRSIESPGSKGTELASLFYLLKVTGRDNADVLRSLWQSKERKASCLLKRLEDMDLSLRRYCEKNLIGCVFDKLEIHVLPSYSFILQFVFELEQPYLSRDDQVLYIVDNPVRQDKIFGLPYVASASWKGILRSALRKLGYDEKGDIIRRLFGSPEGTEGQKDFRAGRLYFFPTFFQKKGFEVINPHDRERRAGINPIVMESIPVGATGIFTLLYVPFDRIGKDKKETHRQLGEDLKTVAQGLQAMFRLYGFGAKTSSGFGITEEKVTDGVIKLRAQMIEKAETRDKEESASSIQAAELPGYLETPGRLKPEYLNPNGTFRERSEVELKQMGKIRRLQYEKAKAWWEREGKKQFEDSGKEPAVGKVSPPESVSAPVAFLEKKFTSFSQLVEVVAEVYALVAEGDVR